MDKLYQKALNMKINSSNQQEYDDYIMGTLKLIEKLKSRDPEKNAGFMNKKAMDRYRFMGNIGKK